MTKDLKINPEILAYYMESERKAAKQDAKNEMLQPQIDKLICQLYARLFDKQSNNGKLFDEERQLYSLLQKCPQIKKFLHGTPEEFIEFANKNWE